ncbi:hypothetical protein A3G98_02135 [Candidatus Nomurabacteria bacterium RIFCSPLOWO2_12_FULL_37_8]|uniref:DUF4190 domain-containing protein n=1 Tax=Candidatus Nomurabacteria bacterium RIFCSPLOWO2_12_FULL_37_8 TaxID=1801793 RepID=A0A1F6Y753_9BACT|nr:MAG: hypothetical protein A3G98_02135 [Candidatus Nomurabacteria bacterium RIFCSPLOWO2_12_FULL_37_8]
MKNKLITLSGFVLGLAPVVAFAQQTGGTPAVCQSGTSITTVQGILCKIGDILSAVVPILIALGVIYFVWGVVTYVIASDEEAKKSGRDRIIYGIIGLAVIIAVWGLVAILRNTFGLSNVQNINFPTTPY